MEYEIKVIVPNAEAQMAFCNKLAMYRFHWMSEQKADEIPALLRLTGELGQILVLDLLERKIVKERIEGGANEKAVWRLFINCPFVCINFDFFWLNKAHQLYMDF